MKTLLSSDFGEHESDSGFTHAALVVPDGNSEFLSIGHNSITFLLC